MFEEKEIESYQQIVAPPELKSRVMKAYHTGYTKNNHIRMYKSLSLLAACLVLVFAVSVFTGRGNRISISFNGRQLAGTPVAIRTQSTENMGSRTAAYGRNMQQHLEISLTVETSSQGSIVVSEGWMQIYAADGKLLFEGSEYTTEGTVNIIWNVAEGEIGADEIPRMHITAKNRTCTLQLRYEATDDVWMIYQK